MAKNESKAGLLGRLLRSLLGASSPSSSQESSATYKWKHFSKEEMECSHCGKCHMDSGFMRSLDALREVFGGPLRVSSGYRCPEYNKEVSHTGLDGPHTTGKAVDILVAGKDARKLISLADEFPGLGVSQKGDWGSRFIHLDQLEVRTWSY